MSLTIQIANCRDCDARPGELHEPGCCIERCSCCGQQAITSLCEGQAEEDRLPWQGVFPGMVECLEFGWYARRRDKSEGGKGYIPCEYDHPGAVLDLNRLHVDARWDRKKKRWVKRRKPLKP